MSRHISQIYSDEIAAKMRMRNYSPARLTTLLGNLDSFTEGRLKKDEPAGQAMESPEERNTAYVVLRAYMKELKGVALRGKPGLLDKAGVMSSEKT